jgi:hypothetical protein
VAEGDFFIIGFERLTNYLQVEYSSDAGGFLLDGDNGNFNRLQRQRDGAA